MLVLFDINGNLILSELMIPGFYLPIVIGIATATIVIGISRVKRRKK